MRNCSHFCQAASPLGSSSGSTAAAVHPSSSSSSCVQGWKCPCCDCISPTAAAAQKHVESHSNVRAFRCCVCGYRGNTLRGMRTHVRIHFDRRNAELCEDNYISCITNQDHNNPATPPNDNGNFFIVSRIILFNIDNFSVSNVIC